MSRFRDGTHDRDRTLGDVLGVVPRNVSIPKSRPPSKIPMCKSKKAVIFQSIMINPPHTSIHSDRITIIEDTTQRHVGLFVGFDGAIRRAWYDAPSSKTSAPSPTVLPHRWKSAEAISACRGEVDAVRYFCQIRTHAKG